MAKERVNVYFYRATINEYCEIVVSRSSGPLRCTDTRIHNLLVGQMSTNRKAIDGDIYSYSLNHGLEMRHLMARGRRVRVCDLDRPRRVATKFEDSPIFEMYSLNPNPEQLKKLFITSFWEDCADSVMKAERKLMLTRTLQDNIKSSGSFSVSFTFRNTTEETTEKFIVKTALEAITLGRKHLRNSVATSVAVVDDLENSVVGYVEITEDDRVLFKSDGAVQSLNMPLVVLTRFNEESIERKHETIDEIIARQSEKTP